MGFSKWGEDQNKSTIMLLSELARFNEVLYVDYPYTYLDVFRGIRGKKSVPLNRLLAREEHLKRVAAQNGARLSLLTLPPFLPANWIASPALYDKVLSWNGALAHKSIKKAASKLGFHKPIVINDCNPALGNALAWRLDERLLVYYCCADVGAASSIKKHRTRHEQKFLWRADLTIVSSVDLLRATSKLSRNCRLVKNGVSLHLFDRPEIEPIAIRQEAYQGVIGYQGTLDERIDFDLLEAAIEKMPNYQFVFVGPVNSDQVSRLEKYRQVQLLGPQAPKKLAAYVAAFDVGLAPFISDRISADLYYSKINEYLAVGKPVVAVPFDNQADYKTIISAVDRADHFWQAILKELWQDSSEKQRQRIAFARQNSWKNKAAQFGGFIREKLEKGAMAY